MTQLNYSISINSTKENVWHIMLDEDTYKQWTAEFYPGSYYIGSWEKGSEIKFVAEEDGELSGLQGRIVENIPYEFVSIEYVGQIVKGQIVTDGEDFEKWIGAHENYRFTEDEGVTSVSVELLGVTDDDYIEKMFEDMWPKALQKLKELCES